MEFNAEILMRELRNGASQEEIANAFATALNKASSTIKAERMKKEEEARKNAEIEKKKIQHAQVVADFYNTYYPEMFGKETVTANTIIEACDSIHKITSKITVNSPLFKFLNL